LKGFSYPPGGPPADLLVEGHGATLNEAFEQVALAMYNAITPLEGISERETFKIEVDGSDMMSLLFNFLDELLFQEDLNGLVTRRLEVKVDPIRCKACAVCFGEHFSQKTHIAKILIKAVTYHLMEIKQIEDGWRIQLVFDI